MTRARCDDCAWRDYEIDEDAVDLHPADYELMRTWYCFNNRREWPHGRDCPVYQPRDTVTHD